MQLAWARATAMAALVSTIGVSQGFALQLGSRPAERWIEVLDRPDRVQRLKIDDVIARLRIKPGDVLADIGAGTGAFSLPFARAVAPGGTVYAVEVDQVLVDHIGEKARSEGVSNVQTVLGEFTDPKLPTQDIGLAFFHDVLHHVKDRAGYLKTLARYIKPGGRIAVIERGSHGPRAGGDHGPGERGENQPGGRPGNRPGGHRMGSELHMTQEQVTGWMADAGFQPAEEYYLFDGGKWFVVFSRR